MMESVSQAVRYDDTELDEDSLEKAKEELKENDEKRRKCLEILKKKLLDKEDLNPCLDEVFLLAFLRVAKFDCNKAYQRLLGYYAERCNLPDIYRDYSPSTIKIVDGARQFFASPYRLKDNSAVLILKRRDYDPSKIHYDLIIRAYSMMCDMITQHPLNQMIGYAVVMDLKSSSWSGFSEYTPARLKMIARLVQKSVPVRIRAVHVMNAPPIYFLLYSIIYPFLSTKIRNRIFLHKNTASLHSYIDPENLPKEYDGCLEQSELINLFERLFEKEDFFLKLSKYGFIKKMK